MSYNDILLIGGPSSGKSTLIGALVKEITLDQPLDNETSRPKTIVEKIKHFLQTEEEPGGYHADPGYSEYFYNHVVHPMNARGKYPGRTESYAVNIDIPDTTRSHFRRTARLHLFDLGGELQDQILGGSESSLLLLSDIKSINDEITDGLSDEKSKRIARKFVSTLDTSAGIIFLINLKHYVDFNGRTDAAGREDGPRSKTPLAPAVFESDLVADKRKNALVITACDTINYRPDRFEPESQGPLGSIYDTELRDRIEQETRDPRIMTLLNAAKRKDNFDMFGVSVPPDPDSSNGLREENGTFVTNGIQSLITWAQK